MQYGFAKTQTYFITVKKTVYKKKKRLNVFTKIPDLKKFSKNSK